MTLLERAERKEKPIPVDNWDRYGGDWPKARRVFTLLTKAETPYESFINLGVHQDCWKTTRELIPSIPGGRVLDLGCGPGSKWADILTLSQARELVGLDFSPQMLARAKNEAENLRSKLDVTILVENRDVTQPWRLEDEPFDLITSDFLVCWLTQDGRKSVFEQIPEHLKQGGRALLSFRNENWHDGRVKNHILEEIIRNPAATFGGLIGAKRHINEMSRMFRDGETDAGPPTREEIDSLLLRNGLEILQERDILYVEDPEGPGGSALLLQKRQV